MNIFEDFLLDRDDSFTFCEELGLSFRAPTDRFLILTRKKHRHFYLQREVLRHPAMEKKFIFGTATDRPTDCLPRSTALGARAGHAGPIHRMSSS